MQPNAHPIFPDSPLPLYAQLADLLRQRVLRGTWKSGDKVPSLEALVEEFQVARVTVRQAIEILTREGMLLPQRGRGTFVTDQVQLERSLTLETSLHGLADAYRNDKPNLTLIEESGVQPPLTPFDGLAAPAYHFMRRVHSRDEKAYCVASIYIDQRAFRLAPKRFRKETVVPVLMDLPQVTIASARQTLRISTADVEIARLLHVAVGSPVAEVRRVCLSPDGTVLYLGQITYRGDFIQFEMALTL
ncbi:MAG: GntR family transcriptional regulator [Betaproteobacteria bacterium]|jgi:GntR family transcriptional regulator|nr:GntR family transcriptional regulator [Burkholderiales bacterium]NBX88961.1 GntR family transcriptional regulator [Betaproteobacteria bacterium]